MRFFGQLFLIFLLFLSTKMQTMELDTKPTCIHSNAIMRERILPALDAISSFTAMIGLMTLPYCLHALTEKAYALGSVAPALIGSAIALPYFTHSLMGRKGEVVNTILPILHFASFGGTLAGTISSLMALPLVAEEKYLAGSLYPLSYAANFALLLLSEAQIKSKQQLFIEAAKNSDLNVIKEFIRSGASINGVDKTGNTALDYALTKSHNDIIINLVNAGANKCKFTNYLRPFSTNNTEIIELFAKINFPKNFNNLDVNNFLRLIESFVAIYKKDIALAKKFKTQNSHLFDPTGCELVIEGLARKGDFYNLKILIEDFNFPFTAEAISAANDNNHSNIVHYLIR